MTSTQYAVVVTIPFDFLLNRLKVMSDDDTLLYQDFLANALADKWNLSDLDFKVVDDQNEHTFSFTPTEVHGEAGEPNEKEFEQCVLEAYNAYMVNHGITSSNGGLSGYGSFVNSIYGQSGQPFLAD